MTKYALLHTGLCQQHEQCDPGGQWELHRVGDDDATLYLTNFDSDTLKVITTKVN